MSTTTTDPVIDASAQLGQMRQVLDALATGKWWHMEEKDLIGVLGDIGQLRHELARVEAHATGEALVRGLPQDRGMGSVDFLTHAQAERAPAPPPGHAAAVVRLAGALREPAEGLRQTLAGFEAGLINTGRASAIVRFYNEVEPHSETEPLAEAMTTINQGALDTLAEPGHRSGAYDPLGRQDREPDAPCRKRGWTDRELRTVLGHSRKLIKPAKEQEGDDRRGRAFRTLHTLPAGADMTEYRLVLEAEGAAIVEAALSALSGPQKDEQGNPDPRSAPRRKADALVDIIQRGVSAPDGVPQTTKAQVMVTIPYTVLLGYMSGGGITMTGQVLSPQTVRRMACDGGIIPAVLGPDGEILDMGRQRRLFTPAQHRALWHRDQGCSFPACTIPAQWCAAHHIEHWTNGGATDLANGALLCQRHHTYVHTHELTATTTPTGVTWHT